LSSANTVTDRTSRDPPRSCGCSMKWRRGDSADGSAAKARDGLNIAAWSAVTTTTVAISKADVRGYETAMKSMTELEPLAARTRTCQWAGIYLRYLIHRKVTQDLGREASREDLVKITDRLFPAFFRLTHGDRDSLRNTLLTPWDFAIADEIVSIGRFAALAPVVLGLLTTDAGPDLNRLRPIVARYCRDNAEFKQAIETPA
jgi:hypothetical protein